MAETLTEHLSYPDGNVKHSVSMLLRRDVCSQPS